jgi:hypothetical protein
MVRPLPRALFPTTDLARPRHGEQNQNRYKQRKTNKNAKNGKSVVHTSPLDISIHLYLEHVTASFAAVFGLVNIGIWLC